MNALIVGYYGYGNAGDQLLLTQTQRLLHHQLPKATLYTLTKKGSGPNEINRFSILSIMITLIKVQTVIFGGGGIFQNKTSQRSLLYYCSLMIFAKIFRADIYLLGQGIGPIQGKFSHWLCMTCLKLAKKIIVRDLDSLSLLRTSNIPAILASDLTFYRAHPKIILPAPTHHLGLALKDTILPIYPKLIPQLNQTSLEYSLISCMPQQETAYLDHATQYPPPQTLQLTHLFQDNSPPHKINFVISMRYHACIWASLNGIPFLALGDDPKLKSIAKSLGQRYLPLSTLHNTFSILPTTITEQLNQYSTYQESLLTHRDRLLQQVSPLEAVFSSS